MTAHIAHDGTTPLRRALERRIAGADAVVSRISDEADALDGAVRAAFMAGMQNVMRLIPADAAPIAERAVRSLLIDVVTRALDDELDAADLIRAEQSAQQHP